MRRNIPVWSTTNRATNCFEILATDQTVVSGTPRVMFVLKARRCRRQLDEAQ